MANQQNSYTGSQGTGTNNADFSFTFPSFTTSEVKVEVDNVVKTLTTHYTVENYNTTSGGKVRFTSGNIPTGTTPLRIFRQTDVDSPKAEFTAGSSLKAGEINDNFKQVRHALQEAIGAVTTDRKVQRFNIEADSIDGTLIADDAVDTEHIANSSVTSNKIADNAVTTTEILNGAVTRAKLEGDIIDGTKLADDAVDTEHIANGAVDTAQLKANSVNADKIADDVINSEHYVDGSIDREHLEADIIDSTKLADNAVGNEHLQNDSVRTAEIQNDAVTIDKIADAAIVTNSEQASHSVNDTTFFTTAAAEARYFNVSTGETIKDVDAFPDNDTTIATTAAINNRIIALVDDVGGFVPIANETSFPTENPDINIGASVKGGTIVSVKTASTNLVPSGTTVTIANGRGSGLAVIITGVSTTIPQGFGFLVETTGTDHTYAFHRLVPKATEVTAVAGKATEIGRLGTAAAVADMAILGTADVVADLNTLGTADVVSDMNTLAVSDVISDMNTLAVTSVVNNMDTVATNVANVNTTAGSISNVNTTAGSISNVNTVAGSIANVNTTAGSIGNVNTVAGSIASVNNASSNLNSINNYGDQYQVASNNPSTDGGGNALAAGDLYFNTSANELKVYNGSAWQAGVTATGNFALTTGNTFTGDNRYNDGVKALFGTGSDLEIFHNNDVNTIRSINGQLFIKGDASNLIGIQSKNGENDALFHPDGAAELYYDNSKKFETSSTGGILRGTKWTAVDNCKLALGTGDDLQIYHDGTDSRIINSNSDLFIYTVGDHDVKILADSQNAVICKPDAEVELHYDNSKKFFTISNGVQATNRIIVGEGTNQRGLLSGDANSVSVGSISNIPLNFNRNSVTKARIDGNNFQIPNDTGKIELGAGQDLKLYHNGNVSYIENATSDLRIRSGYVKLQGINAENMLVGNQNTSVELYYDNSKKLETTSTGATLTGVLATDSVAISSSGYLSLPDNRKIYVGTGNDLQIYHNGSNTFIDNSTGVTNIRGGTHKFRKLSDNEDMLILNPNDAVELYYDNSKKFETTSFGAQFTDNVKFDNPDTAGRDVLWAADQDLMRWQNNTKATFGDSDDLQIYHNGTSNIILANSGDLNIRTNNSENSIVARQNGAVELYYDNSKKFETLTNGVRVTGQVDVNGGSISLEDSRSLFFGASDDLQIYHDGSNSHIAETGTGVLKISGSAGVYINKYDNSETMAAFLHDAGVELYHNNSKKFETHSAGVKVSAGNLYLDRDDAKVVLGASDDLQIVHDGSDSQIINSTGKLYIKSSNFVDIRSSGNETMIKAIPNGAVQLYYDNSEKLATTNTGVKITDNFFGINVASASGTFGGRNAHLAMGDTDTGIAQNGDGQLELWANNQEIVNVDTGSVTVYKDLRPGSNGTTDLGSSNQRWRNLYTSDLNLSNEGSSNDVDGTWGDYTMQEGENDLFLINNRSGRKYKFNLTEVS